MNIPHSKCGRHAATCALTGGQSPVFICMQGFPPMSKYALQVVMKLAACYGLKSSAQGSGKKQFVVVWPLASSCSCLLSTCLTFPTVEYIVLHITGVSPVVCSIFQCLLTRQWLCDHVCVLPRLLLHVMSHTCKLSSARHVHSLLVTFMPP